ncbi:MAG: hypothetical protein HGA39_09830 [Coriobacteriia bacterium]|nr:hypothetical protein [Coriobacteriia bacterium]
MLIDTWYPVTHNMGLIDLPVEAAVSALIEWHASIGTFYTRRDISSSLGDAFEALPPLSAEMRRRVFIGTRSGWTTCFQSGIAGSDPFPAMSFLAKNCGVLAMRVCSTPPSATWPATIWEVYAPPELGGTPPLGYRRAIAAMNDGGRWIFEESGLPFPFEQTEHYSSLRKRDRFTREMLCDYLGNFGLTPFDDAFYEISEANPAVLLENRSRWERPTPEFTLEQVVLGLPWKR